MAGSGVPKNPRQGLALCRQAAELGSPQAAVQTGRYLLEGDDEVRDPTAAFAWFASAAERLPEARFRLGVIYRDGIGQPPSVEAARHWFESAASDGYVRAYYPTARLYLEPVDELGVRRPAAEALAKAYMWLRAAGMRAETAQEREQSRALMEQVLAIMPASWKPALDAKVDAHIEGTPAIR